MQIFTTTYSSRFVQWLECGVERVGNHEVIARVTGGPETLNTHAKENSFGMFTLTTFTRVGSCTPAIIIAVAVAVVLVLVVVFVFILFNAFILCAVSMQTFTFHM